MGRRSLSTTGRNGDKMDTDVNIYERQMREEVKEKYILYKRIDELVRELYEVKERLKKVESI